MSTWGGVPLKSPTRRSDSNSIPGILWIPLGSLHQLSLPDRPSAPPRDAQAVNVLATEISDVRIIYPW